MNTRPENPNFAQLLMAASMLEPMLEQIAFIGGCVTGFLVTDPAAAPVRPTLDVDVIVEAATYAEFTILEQQLRQLGFRESHVQGAPICRWLSGSDPGLHAGRSLYPWLQQPLVSSRPGERSEAQC